MNKKLVSALVLIILVLPIFSATITTVKIKTLPHHEIHLSVLDAMESDNYAYLITKNYSDAYGDSYLTFEIDEQYFDLAVLLKKGSKRVLFERMGETYDVGEFIELTVAPEDAKLIETPSNEINETEELEELVSNETVETETQTEEVVEKSSPGITAKVIDTVKNNSSTVIYSIIGFIFIVGVIGFFVFRGKKERKVVTKKYSELKEEEKKQKDEDDKEDELKEAEAKLEEAQKEINKIKNKKKIEALEKEISKLRDGDKD